MVDQTSAAIPDLQAKLTAGYADMNSRHELLLKRLNEVLAEHDKVMTNHLAELDTIMMGITAVGGIVALPQASAPEPPRTVDQNGVWSNR